MSICETSRHIDNPLGCEQSHHEKCEHCARCYTCGAEKTVTSTLAASVREWDERYPEASSRRNE